MQSEAWKKKALGDEGSNTPRQKLAAVICSADARRRFIPCGFPSIYKEGSEDALESAMKSFDETLSRSRIAALRQRIRFASGRGQTSAELHVLDATLRSIEPEARVKTGVARAQHESTMLGGRSHANE